MKMYLSTAIKLIFFILCIQKTEGVSGRKRNHIHREIDLNKIPVEEEESECNGASASGSRPPTQERPNNITRLHYDSMILQYYYSDLLRWEELRDPDIYMNETRWQKVCLRAWNATPKANYLHCNHGVFTDLTNSKYTILCKSSSKISTRILTETLGCFCEHRIHEKVPVDNLDPEDRFYVAKVPNIRYYKFERKGFTFHVLGEISDQIEEDD